MVERYGKLAVECLTVGMLEVNCYLVYHTGSKAGIVVDPGEEGERILSRVKQADLKIETIVLTHGHGDHIGAVDYLRKNLPAKVAIGSEDAPMLSDPAQNLSLELGLAINTDSPEIVLSEGDRVEVGDIALKVVHTPGHTAGGISLVGEGFVIGGDLVFAGSIGRVDLPGGDYGTILSSIKEKILPLGDEYVIFPGHGPATSVAQEKLFNPFLMGER